MNHLRYVCLCLICLGTMASAQTNPAPLLNNPLVPMSAVPGRAGFTLTLNGTGFVAGSVVKWNGRPLATTFVTSSQLTANVPASHIASEGTASVNVVNPAPGGGVSNVGLFVIRRPFPATSFGQGSAIPISLYAGPGVVGDFNRDGKPDLVFPVSSSMGGGNGTIQACLGNGDGTFQMPVDYQLDVAYPSSPIAADFNGDGKLDLLVTGYGAFGAVSVLLGNGDGTLQPPKDSFVSNTEVPTFVVAGDFDGGGTLDLAVSLYLYQSAARVAILLGNEDGTFQPPNYYAVGTDFAYGVVTGDFNGDGKLDLAAAVSYDFFSNNQVAVLLGNGDGTFQDPAVYPTPGQDFSLVAADFNGDGKLDLAVTVEAGTSGPAILVALGNGDGTLQPFIANPTASDSYSILAAVDINGDGKLDLVASFYQLIAVFTGRGDGTFQADYNPAPVNNVLAVGDFDGDGRVDVVTIDAYHPTASVNVRPQITTLLSQGYVDFGSVKPGTIATAKVTLSNFGKTSLTIMRIGFTDNFGVFKETNDCGQTLPPHASCTFKFAFKPQGTKNASATVKIAYGDGSQPQEIIVAGKGTP